MFGSFDISTSALVAQRSVMDTIAGNIANMDARSPSTGDPYRRRVALLATDDSAGNGSGVRVARIVSDPSPFRLKFDPSDRFSIKDGSNKGYVRMPNVDYGTEMVNSLMAARAYEANITVMEMTKTMAASSLRLLA